MLTKKQQELLLFIHQRLTDGGVSPSFDEMKEALNLRSKSGIHRLITGLEERGFIRRLAHRARALEVVKMPDNLVPTARVPQAPFKPSVIQGGMDVRRPAGLTGRGLKPVTDRPPTEDTQQIPLYGKIAAGTPIEALRDNSAFAEVPPSLLGQGEHYALEVDGDSMIDAGIHDGDVVIIKRTDQAENGAIVVALVDGGEVTLKRLRRKGNTIALEPANAAHETRIYGADRVQVQGRLVGLIRKY